MDILFHKSGDDPAPWLAALARELPDARIRAWQPGDNARADYVLTWRPPVELLHAREGLKAVFNIGAGVDALLAFIRESPGLLPPSVMLIKLDDAGMGAQMVQYVCHAVLRHFRRFDDYARQQAGAIWKPLAPHAQASWPIGVMGMGALGAQVAGALAGLGFIVRGWSRRPRPLTGVQCHAGRENLPAFLDGLQVLINLLPLTPDTENILDSALFARLARGAQLINVARGAHLVEADLLEALDTGQLACATLDVVREEPLPATHPFWRDPRIDLTPHVSAVTVLEEGIRQIAEKIRRLEAGESVDGVVDLARGY